MLIFALLNFIYAVLQFRLIKRSVILLSDIKQSVILSICQWCYNECHLAIIIMMSAILFSVILFSVVLFTVIKQFLIMLSVILLSTTVMKIL